MRNKDPLFILRTMDIQSIKVRQFILQLCNVRHHPRVVGTVGEHREWFVNPEFMTLLHLLINWAIRRV